MHTKARLLKMDWICVPSDHCHRNCQVNLVEFDKIYVTSWILEVEECLEKKKRSDLPHVILPKEPTKISILKMYVKIIFCIDKRSKVRQVSVDSRIILTCSFQLQVFNLVTVDLETWFKNLLACSRGDDAFWPVAVSLQRGWSVCCYCYP